MNFLSQPNTFSKILSWLWLLTIAYLSLTPQIQPPISFDQIDKILHLGSYGLATLLVLIAYPCASKLRIIFSLFAYSFSMELGQLFVENRFFEFYDLLANLTGILIVAYLIKAPSFIKYLKVGK
jgi:VanZ family protein